MEHALARTVRVMALQAHVSAASSHRASAHLLYKLLCMRTVCACRCLLVFTATSLSYVTEQIACFFGIVIRHSSDYRSACKMQKSLRMCRSSPSVAMSPTDSGSGMARQEARQDNSPQIHASPLAIRRPGASSEWTRSGSPMRTNCQLGGSHSLGSGQQQSGLELASSKLAHLVHV